MEVRELTPKERTERDRNTKVWYDEKGRRRVTIYDVDLPIEEVD